MLPVPFIISQYLNLLIKPVSSLELISAQSLNINLSTALNVSTPNASFSPTPPPSLLSNPYSPNLTTVTIQCDGATYGDDLNLNSCVDAFEQIPHYVNELTWGPRTQGQWNVNLPWRIYSCMYDHFIADLFIDNMFCASIRRTVLASLSGYGYTK